MVGQKLSVTSNSGYGLCQSSERKERSHRLIVKGAEFEKAFPLSRDLEQEEVQEVMNQLQNSSYNKSIVRQVHIAALHKEQQQIAEAVEKAERGDDG